MAAAAAGLAVGLPERAVVRGLRTFVLDPERNPGRANLFRLDGRIVVIDYAHNEAGMAASPRCCDGLRAPGREIWLAICTAGDRTDAILHAFAFRAAVGRGSPGGGRARCTTCGARPRRHRRAAPRGRARGGRRDVPSYDDELHALRAMLGRRTRGDVIGVTALGHAAGDIRVARGATGRDVSGPADVRTHREAGANVPRSGDAAPDLPTARRPADR